MPAIAKGLPARIHRFAAYAMAAEVCAADGRIVAAESDFLERLRLSLRITPKEADLLLNGAMTGQVGDLIDHHLRRTRRRIPLVIEVFALRAHARGDTSDHQLDVVRDLLDDEDSAVRRQAARSLAQLARRLDLDVDV